MQPTHTILNNGGFLKNCTQGGGHPDPTPAGTYRRGGGSGSTNRTGRGVRDATVGPHNPPTPAPIPTQDPTPPHFHLQGDGPTKWHTHPGLHPPTSTSKGVGQPRGKPLTHGYTSCTGIGHARALRCHGPRLCSRAAGNGDGRSGGSPTLPFTKRTLREGSKNLAIPPLLRMQGGGRFGLPSHLGEGGPHERGYVGDRQPQPYLVEGALLLSASLWGEGAL